MPSALRFFIMPRIAERKFAFFIIPKSKKIRVTHHLCGFFSIST